MKAPDFVKDWIERMPYHQIAEFTQWMDSQENLTRSFQKMIGESVDSYSSPICENCGRMMQSHRQVDGTAVCYPDTFPDDPMIFRGPQSCLGSDD